MRVEDYAVVGDTETVALISTLGSVDWLCFPRFDSGACFSALLGTAEHGRWLLAPCGEVQRTRRRYVDSTLILETEVDTADGTIRIRDLMPIRGHAPDLVRIVEGVRGRVPMRMELAARYDYDRITPWVRREGRRFHIVAGPDALVLAMPFDATVRQGTIETQFSVEAGEKAVFVLTYYPSFAKPPETPSADEALRGTHRWWQTWANASHVEGPYRDAVVRSLVAIKALTYAPSGGIVAAGTTSLPEALGGVRNWDYRYCWLRDATLTLQALLHCGHTDEARAWREWLVRAVAGDPEKLQIMYGVAGERRLDERELDWLPGYESSRPVRVGNAAVGQRQLDVFGELMDALYVARSAGLDPDDDAWTIQRACLDWLEGNWMQPDEGMWEVRSGRHQFTFSKVMCWAAFDRGVKTIEQHRLDGPAARWRAVRDEIHAEVCTRGFDPARQAFTQSYGSRELDASLLLVPIVGFLPGTDARVLSTIDAIQRELVVDGFVQRYPTHAATTVDGLHGREGSFLACSFWLVDALVLADRVDEARTLFERLLDVRNDVGLLSEEYDVHAHRLVGNFPQAFSHVALINSARNLSVAHGPARERARRSGNVHEH